MSSLPWEKGSGTSLASSENIYENNTYRKELSSWEAASQGPTVLNMSL